MLLTICTRSFADLLSQLLDSLFDCLKGGKLSILNGSDFICLLKSFVQVKLVCLQVDPFTQLVLHIYQLFGYLVTSRFKLIGYLLLTKIERALNLADVSLVVHCFQNSFKIQLMIFFLLNSCLSRISLHHTQTLIELRSNSFYENLDLF